MKWRVLTYLVGDRALHELTEIKRRAIVIYWEKTLLGKEPMVISDADSDIWGENETLDGVVDVYAQHITFWSNMLWTLQLSPQPKYRVRTTTGEFYECEYGRPLGIVIRMLGPPRLLMDFASARSSDSQRRYHAQLSQLRSLENLVG